jgi:hypothetical protein
VNGINPICPIFINPSQYMVVRLILAITSNAVFGRFILEVAASQGKIKKQTDYLSE